MSFKVASIHPMSSTVKEEWERLAEKANLALEALPVYPDEIAEFLEVRGIKAVPCSRSQCALAEYFIQQTGIPDVSVTPLSMALFGCTQDGMPYLEFLEFQAGYAGLREFIDKFDSEEYPDIVDNVRWSQYLDEGE